jgi:hypothetical protein
MKKLIIFALFIFKGILPVSAQNPEYVKAMEEVVSAVQSAQFGSDLTEHENKFERIASVETKEWLPNYWAAYCLMMNSYIEKDADKKDLLLEKAEKMIANAEKLMPNNDEIEVMKANIASARMAVDPQNRWQKYGTISGKSLKMAQKINPENPRAKLLEAQGIFFTPENFGGGKAKAKPLLEDAIQKFAKFKPNSSIAPNWGEMTAKWMISQI